MLGTGSIPSVDPVGYERNVDGVEYDRGHLIAKKLGGTGDDKRNLVPLNQHENRGKMRVDEGKIASDVSYGFNTYVYSVPIYVNDNPIPEKVVMFTLNSLGANIYIFRN